MKAGEAKPSDEAEKISNEDRGRAQREINRQDDSREQLKRYQQRLEEQAQQQPGQQQGQAINGNQPGTLGSRPGASDQPFPAFRQGWRDAGRRFRRRRR